MFEPTTMKTKALSVRQPWANLLIWGLKSIEIRSWSTLYRGRLFIHAAKTIDERAMQRFRIDSVPTGFLIGSVELIDVEKLTPERWSELADEHLDPGTFVPNLYAWCLSDPRPLDQPIACRGDRGLFEVSMADEVVLPQQDPGTG